MKHLLYGLIILSMMSCTSKKDSYTQEQLYEQASSGVVLIQNTYYSLIPQHYYKIFFLST